jgi:hypothetical protein
MSDNHNVSSDSEETPIKGNVDRVPGYATSLEASGPERNVRDSELVDPQAETPSRASHAGFEAGADVLQGLGDEPDSDRETGFPDRGGADLIINNTSTDGKTIPPPSAHRADTMVRGVAPDARQQMERGNQQTNEPSFTKGDNAPTVDQSRYPYRVEDMDALLTEAPRGLFPDTPGGDGATPLSVERGTFLTNMRESGQFSSQDETVTWARAVFNAIRERALTHDPEVGGDFSVVVRIGEAPEVQVEEMMWGGDFLGRMRNALNVDSKWSVQDFYGHVAGEAGLHVDNPKVEAAIVSYLGTLKPYLPGDGMTNLNELQELWDRV